MKKIAVIMGLFIMVNLTHAQKYYITNQYVYDLYLMNPAAAAFYKGCYTVNGYYQKQWYGLENAPATQIVSYQGPAAEGVGLGMYMYNDRNGFFGELGFQAAMSYEVTLIKKRRSKSSLSFGLSVTGEQSALNQTELSEAVLNDPAMSGSRETGMGLNASAGVLLKYNRYHTGLSVTNVLPQTNPMFLSPNDPDLTMDIHFHVGTTYKLKDRDIFVEPLLMYRRNLDVNSRLDLNVKGYFPTLDPNLSYWGMLGYRHTMDESFGKSLGFATTVGVQVFNFRVGVEYQTGLTRAQADYGSAYQLVVGYRYCINKRKASLPCSEENRNKRVKMAKKIRKGGRKSKK